MSHNNDKTKLGTSPTGLLFGAESAQDATVEPTMIYNYKYFMDNIEHQTPTFLADHIARAVLGKNPEWLLVIRKVIRDLFEKECTTTDSLMLRLSNYSTLLTVISAFLERSNIATLT